MITKDIDFSCKQYGVHAYVEGQAPLRQHKIELAALNKNLNMK